MEEAQWRKAKERCVRQKHGNSEVELKEFGRSILSITSKERWADGENHKDYGNAAVSQLRVNKRLAANNEDLLHWESMGL